MKKSLAIGVAALGLVALAVPSKAQVIYQDSFNRTGNLAGSFPDTDAGGDAWQTSLPSIYSTSAGTVSINAGTYSYQGAFLPVNDNASDQLTGLQDFTLSATMQAGAEGTSVGIALLDAPVGGYQGFNNDALASVQLGTSYEFWTGGGQSNYVWEGATSPTVLSLVYSAEAGTITYDVGSTVIETVTGVTPGEISALTDVSFGFGGNSTPQTATAESFELSVVPEPSTIWLCGLGLIGLLGFQARRGRLAKS